MRWGLVFCAHLLACARDPRPSPAGARVVSPEVTDASANVTATSVNALDAGAVGTSAEVPEHAATPPPDAGAPPAPTVTAAPQHAHVTLSDDCEGERLRTGLCVCAHRQCMDVCCRQNEACAHGGSEGSSKCIRVPGR